MLSNSTCFGIDLNNSTSDCAGGGTYWATTTMTTGKPIADYIREALLNVETDKFKEAAILFDSRAVPGINIPPITDIAEYNNRVVKVTFADGTFTKCEAESEAEYDFYTGLAFCLFKKFLGDDGHKKFNRLMKYALKRDDEIWNKKQEEARAQKAAKEKRRKIELKRAAKRAKMRQEQVSMQSDAMLDALRKFKIESRDN